MGLSENDIRKIISLLEQVISALIKGISSPHIPISTLNEKIFHIILKDELTSGNTIKKKLRLDSNREIVSFLNELYETGAIDIHSDRGSQKPIKGKSKFRFSLLELIRHGFKFIKTIEKKAIISELRNYLCDEFSISKITVENQIKKLWRRHLIKLEAGRPIGSEKPEFLKVDGREYYYIRL